MCDTTHDKTPTPCEPLKKPKLELISPTRTIEDLKVSFKEIRRIPLWNMVLQEHYKKNTHHPEHFSDPSQMDDLSRKHMLCDLLASFWGSQRKHSIYDEWTLPQVANVCKDWSKWKWVQDLYPGSYEESGDLLRHARWNPKRYRMEKKNFQIYVKGFLLNTIGKQSLVEGLYAFRCVHDYLEDLRWHQQTIVDVGKALFPDDEALHAELATHDDDKWDALMVAGYVWKWIFEEEIIEIDECMLVRVDDGAIIGNITDSGREELRKIRKENFSSHIYGKDDEPAKCTTTEE